jgi:hypothetical protein
MVTLRAHGKPAWGGDGFLTVPTCGGHHFSVAGPDQALPRR